MPSQKFQQFTAEAKDRQLTLAAFLRAHLNCSWSEAKKLIAQQRVFLNGAICNQVDHRLKPGFVVQVRTGDAAPTAKPKAPAKPRLVRPVTLPSDISPPKIIYQDDWLVIVDKPAGLTTTRSREERLDFGEGKGKFLPVTLQELLPGLLNMPDRPIHPVHRIDKETSGLVVFARDKKTAESLDVQFREHSIRRMYLALCRGTPPAGWYESLIVADRGDGRRGKPSRVESLPQEVLPGERAKTHIEVLAEQPPLSLVRCQLETGRTHQVRIHLGELGTPICGDRIYDRPVHGAPLSDPTNASRHMLHAVLLGITHPQTGRSMSWEVPPPADFQSIAREFSLQANYTTSQPSRI